MVTADNTAAVTSDNKAVVTPEKWWQDNIAIWEVLMVTSEKEELVIVARVVIGSFLAKELVGAIV